MPILCRLHTNVEYAGYVPCIFNIEHNYLVEAVALNRKRQEMERARRPLRQHRLGLLVDGVVDGKPHATVRPHQGTTDFADA